MCSAARLGISAEGKFARLQKPCPVLRKAGRHHLSSSVPLPLLPWVSPVLCAASPAFKTACRTLLPSSATPPRCPTSSSQPHTFPPGHHAWWTEVRSRHGAALKQVERFLCVRTEWEICGMPLSHRGHPRFVLLGRFP